MFFVLCQLKGGGRRPPFVLSFVFALNKAHVLALITPHVLRLNKADVLSLNKAYVLRLSTKICPMSRANTKEAVFGRSHNGGGQLSAACPLRGRCLHTRHAPHVLPPRTSHGVRACVVAATTVAFVTYDPRMSSLIN